MPGYMMSHNHEILPAWLSAGSAIVLVLLIINGYMKKFFRKDKKIVSRVPQGQADNIVTMNVKGMTCNHCKQSVENAALGVRGVESVDVDLGKGKLTLEGKDIDLDKIRKNIRSAGYEID